MDYKTAYNKIIDAYFKDEIQPFQEQFCFCGTLSPNKNWSRNRSIDAPILKEYPYTVNEYALMESALFSKMPNVKWKRIGFVERLTPPHFNEDELFSGMCAALDALKQIHKERGENVDEEIQFKKRELTNSSVNNLK